MRKVEATSSSLLSRGFMPIDRKLAIESLKRLDDRLYEMYARLSEVEEYVKANEETFQKLRIYLISLDVFDDLERMGVIEIINDYDRNAVLVRRKCR